MDDQKMLFLCYWELNENMPVLEHLKIGKMLTESGLFPPKDVELIRFDMTPDYWGVTVFKAASAEAAFNLVEVWRMAGTGIFKKMNVSPALTVMEAKALAANLFQSVKAVEAQVKQKEMAPPGK